MKKIFFSGLLGLLLFEIANVYFIMPMPGSQRMQSLNVAYVLYNCRWLARFLFGAMMLIGFVKAKWKRRLLPLIPTVIVAAIIYVVNFQMAADHMFYQLQKITTVDAAANKVDSQRLVIGIVLNNEAKAYPVRLLGYHHLVPDVVGGKSVLVTYCTVCRTGRVYEPAVQGKPETFRLVGMDHFNAMFEDATTKSWWRQANGEAVTGKLKGQQLPEILSTQTTLAEWLTLYPKSLVMQEDPAFKDSYDTTFKFENGKSSNKLTGTDSLSWRDKSWVVGIRVGNASKAYDWNAFKSAKLIHDHVGNKNILLALAKDDKSFFALELPENVTRAKLVNDTIFYGQHRYKINGVAIDTTVSLKQIQAYQEFLHSWQTFNPATLRY